MVHERDDWGYYVRAIRDLTHPPSWRWRIIRRGNPMGVLLEAGGFSTYEAARFAGNDTYGFMSSHLVFPKFLAFKLLKEVS